MNTLMEQPIEEKIHTVRGVQVMLDKDYGFRDQITRSSLSIPSNIAEGMEKDYPKEKNRFLEIAKGSTAELITQIYIGIEIDYIDKTTGLDWRQRLNEVSKMIVGLAKYHKPKP